MGLEVWLVWKAGGKTHLGGHSLHRFLLSAFSEALEAEEGVGGGIFVGANSVLVL